MIKDPQDVLRREFDWSAFLDEGEAITSHTVSTESGDVVVGASTLDGSIQEFSISGGTEGSVARVVAHVVTDAGREADRTIDLFVTQPIDYVAVATQIVRRITGGRWTWPPMQVRDLFDVPPGTRFLQLRAEPVLEVVSVLDYKTGSPIEFVRMGSNRIELVDNRCAGRRRIDVTYNYGNRPSAVVLHAIQVLATEMQKADVDDDECRIPSRVVTVNRQGVSWTLIDPMDFLDKGRTGIIEVDMALNASVTKGRARPRVFSVEHPPPDRLSATQLPYPVP